jgi:hypothetical protein
MNKFQYLVTVETMQKYPDRINRALWETLEKLKIYGAIEDTWKCEKNYNSLNNKKDLQSGTQHAKATIFHHVKKFLKYWFTGSGKP